MPQRILFVLSSAQKSLQGDPTVSTRRTANFLRYILNNIIYRGGTFLRRHTLTMSCRRTSLSTLLPLLVRILRWTLLAKR